MAVKHTPRDAPRRDQAARGDDALARRRGRPRRLFGRAARRDKRTVTLRVTKLPRKRPFRLSVRDARGQTWKLVPRAKRS